MSIVETKPNTADGDSPTSTWWRNGVVYQVYIRSFADGNGDGIGDIAGLRSRLGYLRDLGIDAIWINPWYKSPLDDGGYDVADYREIDERIGTTAEATEMIAEAHALGIRVIGDLVPNHTSSEHIWFQEALAAVPGSAARARFHFCAGRGPDGSEPPNNWTSCFGGSAWTRVPDGEWYLHLFAITQPDLNWENPEVLHEFESVLRYWLDLGLDGFRVDVAHGMSKDMDFPDLAAEMATGNPQPGHPFWDREGVHAINRAFRAVLDEYDDRMMVAEGWVRPERVPFYIRPDEYHQSFNFKFLGAGWDIDRLRQVIPYSASSAGEVGSTTTWVMSNHDVVRHATRFGLPADITAAAWLLDGPHDLLEPELGLRRARAAALLMLCLPGSAYIYQGEELGLPEVWDLPSSALQDPTWEMSGYTSKGRDGCRVPLPWTSEGPSMGFGAGGSWLPQPDYFAAFAVERQQGDDHSTLELHRRALALRRVYCNSDEVLRMLELGDDVLTVQRGSGLICVVNFGATAFELPAGEVLLASSPTVDRMLEPNDAAWILPATA